MGALARTLRCLLIFIDCANDIGGCSLPRWRAFMHSTQKVWHTYSYGHTMFVVSQGDEQVHLCPHRRRRSYQAIVRRAFPDHTALRRQSGAILENCVTPCTHCMAFKFFIAGGSSRHAGHHRAEYTVLRRRRGPLDRSHCERQPRAHRAGACLAHALLQLTISSLQGISDGVLEVVGVKMVELATGAVRPLFHVTSASTVRSLTRFWR